MIVKFKCTMRSECLFEPEALGPGELGSLTLEFD